MRYKMTGQKILIEKKISIFHILFSEYKRQSFREIIFFNCYFSWTKEKRFILLKWINEHCQMIQIWYKNFYNVAIEIMPKRFFLKTLRSRVDIEL